MNKNIVYGGILIAIVIALGGYFFPKPGFVTGGVSNFDAFKTASLAVGASGCDNSFGTCTGTAIGQILTGTCNLSSNAAVTASFAATSTGQFYCSVTSVLANDNVFVTLPPGAGTVLGGASSLYGGFGLVSATATTTGTIGITLSNTTGAATSSFAQATTSITYFIVRD